MDGAVNGAEAKLQTCRACGHESAMPRVGIRGDGKPVRKCLKCGCGVLDVELTPETVASFYSETYFTEEHPAYFANLQQQVVDPTNLASLLLDRLAAFVTLKGAQFLDIGCAAGVLLAAARNRGADVLGLEISASAAEMPRNAFSVEVLRGRPEDHALPAGAFDVVCMIDVIEHVLCPRRDIEIVGRILKQGGVLCLLTPNFRAYRVFGKRWHGFNASYEHVLYFDRNSLTTLINQYGFKPIAVDTYGMVNLVEYYLPTLSRILPQWGERFLTRAFSKALRAFGCEHRLLMIARKT
jgi:2-polyprenyl-3-methyl-5-hydroxy-6-metoxy-1,4-benzoquinol methylase